MKTLADVIPDKDERDAIIAHMIMQGNYVHGIIGYGRYTYAGQTVNLPMKQQLRIPNHGKFVILEAPNGRKVARQTFKPGEVLRKRK